MTICPYCNYEATEHETLEGATNKKDGDVSFCINCGEVSEFHESVFGKLIKVNVEALDPQTKAEVKKIEKAWLQTKHMNRAVKGEVKGQ